MSRNWLGLPGIGIGVPVMFFTMPDEHTSHCLKFFYQLFSFHLSQHQFFDFSNVRYFTRFDIR